MSFPAAPPLLDTLQLFISELRQQYDQSASSMGLTMARARVLTALLRHDGVTQAELCKIIGTEAPSLKRHLDALEAEGYIARCGLEGDNRKKVIHLTEKGRDNETTRFVQQLRRDLLQGVSDEEQRLVCEVLEKIRHNAAGLAKS